MSDSHSREDMLVLDGCAVARAVKLLEHAETPVMNHFVVTEMGVEKVFSEALKREDIDRVKALIRKALTS
ncbi:MAG: putative zinc-binding protein [Syntrophales bacterium]